MRNIHRIRWILIVVVPAIVFGLMLLVSFLNQRTITTNNAYVQADTVYIGAEVEGKISAVLVDENELVSAGRPLFRIDSLQYEIALTEAQANLEAVRSDIESLKALYRQKLAELKLANSTFEYARRELQRQAQLLERQTVSARSFEAAEYERNATLQRISVIQEELGQILAELGGNVDSSVSAHPRYLFADAARKRAEVNLERTVITAPFPGVATKTPRVGHYVKQGTAVMSIVANDHVWVDANFKETDLAYLKPGQAVTMRVDAYHRLKLRGSIESIAQATGATFSLLPPQNASGNWVKVVQRVPVRIAVDSGPDMPPLRVGMSVEVEVKTGEKSALADRISRVFR